MQRCLAFQQRHDSTKQERGDQNRKRAKYESVEIKKQNAERFVRSWRSDGRAPKIPDPDCQAHEKAAADPGREVIDQAASPRHAGFLVAARGFAHLIASGCNIRATIAPQIAAGQVLLDILRRSPKPKLRMKKIPDFAIHPPTINKGPSNRCSHQRPLPEFHPAEAEHHEVETRTEKKRRKPSDQE